MSGRLISTLKSYMMPREDVREEGKPEEVLDGVKAVHHIQNLSSAHEVLELLRRGLLLFYFPSWPRLLESCETSGLASWWFGKSRKQGSSLQTRDLSARADADIWQLALLS